MFSLHDFESQCFEKSHVKSNIVIISFATIKKIIDSKNDRVDKNESNFVIVFFDYSSKMSFFMNAVSVFENRNKRYKFNSEDFDSKNARFSIVVAESSYEFSRQFEQFQFEQISDVKMINKSKKRTKQREKKKALKSITKMIDQSKISITNILLQQTIFFSIMHLYQLFS